MLARKLRAVYQPTLRIVAARMMSTSSGKEVSLDLVNGKGLIKLNRPKALNALNLDMINQMYPILKDWNSNNKVSMVLIEGEGSKSFCAGGDVRAITGVDSEIRGTKRQVEFFANEYRLNHLIGTLSVPYVALIDGITMGGGVGLSVHGKYRVATENTVFAMPETGIGLFPDVGGTFFMPRLRGELGMYLALVGHRLKGSDCYHAGIATHLCPADQVSNLKEDLVNSSSDEIANVLEAYHQKFNLKPFSLEADLPLINEACQASSVEEILSNFKANSQESKLASRAVDTMAKLSPTSMKITHRQMSEGKKLESLKECLEMEFKMVVRCCIYPDFYEGVRALLVDKDNLPKWNPATLSEVSSQLVDKYFEELPEDLQLQL